METSSGRPLVITSNDVVLQETPSVPRKIDVKDGVEVENGVVKSTLLPTDLATVFFQELVQYTEPSSFPPVETSEYTATASSTIFKTTSTSSETSSETTATVLESFTYLTNSSAEKQVLAINLRIPETSSFSYTPGDAIAVYAPNPPEVVQVVLDRMKRSSDELLNVDEKGEKKTDAFFPDPISIRTALTEKVDLMHPPSQRSIRTLAEYTTNSTEKAALLVLSGQSESEKALYHVRYQKGFHYSLV